MLLLLLRLIKGEEEVMTGDKKNSLLSETFFIGAIALN